ncbi:MAG: T9SS type A sorting domain-containing protein [Bacteroidota bacterium]
MKNYIVIILFLPFILLNAQTPPKFAGFRASRILQSYPGNKFPSADYWSNTGKSISGKFNGFSTAAVWIVSLYIDNGETLFNFPSDGYTVPKVSFINTDQNEEYLDRFDAEGIKVWLQVEPGAASVDTLIHIVLSRYGHHTCIAGFGVDVEWLDPQLDSWGRQVKDAEARRWEAKVKTFNPAYTLFLKHFTKSRMPASYRGDIMFIDDSQDFTTSSHKASDALNNMINEFKAWGNSFPGSKVAFQYGYSVDEWWWSQLNDPLKTIGDRLMQAIPNCGGLFWVDFTIAKLFPVTGVADQPAVVSAFELGQNYPNPFNASTVISYRLTESAHVSLKVYDVLGNEVKTLRDEFQSPGEHAAEFSAQNSTLPSGIYMYRLTAGRFQQTKKLMLLK